MKKSIKFSSTIWRFGPWFFPQYITVNKNGFEYYKLKFKNYFGISKDTIQIKRKFINGVYFKTHFFSGTEIFIENISGNYVHLKNFRRGDAELIQELILKKA